MIGREPRNNAASCPCGIGPKCKAGLTGPRVSALNITADKHPQNTYENLLSDIFKMRMSAKIRGETHGILGSLVKQRKDGQVVTLHGYIYKFLHIEPDGRWFNLQETKEADDSDLRAIRIPDHLKPNLKQFEFIFYVSDHRMVIQTYHDVNSLSISSLSKFFARLFGLPEIAGKYGDINITIEVEKDKLEQLYNIPQLDKLTINVVRPNPDDLHGAEQRVFERMSNQGARKYDVVWEA